MLRQKEKDPRCKHRSGGRTGRVTNGKYVGKTKWIQTIQKKLKCYRLKIYVKLQWI